MKVFNVRNSAFGGELCHSLRKRIESWVSFIPQSLSLFTLLVFEGLLISQLTRVILWVQCWEQSSHSPLAILLTFFCGIISDLVGNLAIVMLFTLPWLFCTRHLRERPLGKALAIGTTFILSSAFFFNATAEYFFWQEFGTRFNFIAVDYLAYSTEVLGNIHESYPLGKILIGVVLLSSGATFIIWEAFKKTRHTHTHKSAFGGVATAIIVISAFLTIFVFPLECLANRFNLELSRNGICSFVEAFFSNQLDYDDFYKTREISEVDGDLRRLLAVDGGMFLTDNLLDIRRRISAEGLAKSWNVILIMEESLSASFTGVLSDGKKSHTPEFDKLCNRGMLLEKCFASGTRTVRGIEAVQLAVPPTPGQSIVKRPRNSELASMGKLFRMQGYDCTFLYGGYGFFDNMNDFFGGNGYDIQDRRSSHSTPQTFANAWGCCDEDVFQWALDNADRSNQAGKPFHQFIVTTSNHRPYTFPDGKIDAPQGHRSSAVRYSDYALGNFLRDAETRPWFANTLFVIVADHCHSTAGHYALPLEKYHIPALFYKPGDVTPRRITAVCSQIDIAPTIFGLLNWNYVTEFFGCDVRKLPPSGGRAFPGTFQTLGYLNGTTGMLTMLKTKRGVSSELWTMSPPFENVKSSDTSEDTNAAIAFFQAASIRYDKQLSHFYLNK